MINVRRLGLATLTTPDLQRQIAYYTDVIGLQELYRDSTRAVLATKLGVEAIALEKGEQAGLARLALQVKPGTDLSAVMEDLSAMGLVGERRRDPTPGVAECVTIVDPKGTPIDLFAESAFGPLDQSWHAIMPLKLGHVAYRVTDVQKIVRFYQEALGFRVSDWRGDYFVFLRCNPDHHTLNFVRDDVPALHHIAFEVKDWAEIQRACDFLGRKEIRLTWGPGRHIIGHNVAIYHKNSDGVRVELFTEMDQMKDEELGYFDPRPWHQDRPQRPKTWGPETLRNYWGFGSERNLPGYR